MHWIKQPIRLLSLLFITSQLLHAAPFVPESDQQILETLPSDSPPARYLNSDSFSSSTSTVSPEQTSQLLERAYLQGDPRALGQARAQLDQTTDQSVETLMLRARALQSDHQFSKAKELLQQILSKDAANPDALLTLSSLLVVQGQFDEAMDYCKKLTDSSLRVYQLACEAQIQSMSGELTQAKQKLSGLASIASGLDSSTARWIYLMQADAALRSQDASLAAQVFSVMDDQTVPALMARADWLLKNGKYQEVRQLLEDHTDKDALLLRLITAQIKLNDPKAQQNLALMKERIEVWQVRQENAHMREQATYAVLANQTDSALQLARENWQEQRETADILIYATAAIKAGSQKDIKQIRQFMQDTQFEYPALERDLRLGKISGSSTQTLSAETPS
ncbi:tetratricopeptide repeat protein [Psychrobacter sp. 72-O-c]|uniref:tetratricopeptide repeat protein n=1 Tax=Psychrobacter sp. 72-O-c TaxID=2774125 RepID=UPI00191A8139|nr:tetratricopeptide repeat protein [Psychrobacter sp. 72-O-c]